MDKQVNHIGKDAVLTLKLGEHIHIDGDCKCAWRVNGRPKVWKRKFPNRVELPIKFGLYMFGNLYQYHTWHRESECLKRQVTNA